MGGALFLRSVGPVSPERLVGESGGSYMRIVMVSHSTMAWTPQFARFFRDRGDDLLVASFTPDPLDGVEGVEMEFIGVEPFDPRRNKHVYFTHALRLRRLVRRFRPELVFACYLTSNGLTAALTFGGPIAVTVMGGDVMMYAPWSAWKRRAREAIIRLVCRRAALINTVLRELADELVRLGVSPSKLLNMPIGVDLGRFRPHADMPRAAGNRFICTRKHNPLYDIGTVIDALGQLKAAGRSFADA